MLPAAYTAAAALYSSPLTSSALSFGAAAYLALSATPAQAATFNVRGSQANSGQLKGDVTVNANTNGASNEMALLKKEGVECGNAAFDPCQPAPPPPAPPPPSPPPPAPTPPAPTPPAPTPPAPTPTALGAQSSSSPLPYQTNATFIETFANSSGITSLIGTTLDLNPETTSQYLAHNSSVLTSMMAGNKSSTEVAINNFTEFLSSPQLTKEQTTALIGITTSQVDYLGDSGQISNSTSSSFFETTANFTTNTSANSSTSVASANSSESKQDSRDLLGLIALTILVPIGFLAVYSTRRRQGVVPGVNVANADLIIPGPGPELGAGQA